MSTNTEIVAQVLTEYGMAFRLSWANVDGRCVRGDMDDFAAALTTDDEADIQILRFNADLCLAGNGHWTEFCGTECEVAA